MCCSGRRVGREDWGGGEGTFLKKGSLSPSPNPSLSPSQDFRPYRIPPFAFPVCRKAGQGGGWEAATLEKQKEGPVAIHDVINRNRTLCLYLSTREIRRMKALSSRRGKNVVRDSIKMKVLGGEGWGLGKGGEPFFRKVPLPSPIFPFTFLQAFGGSSIRDRR